MTNQVRASNHNNVYIIGTITNVLMWANYRLSTIKPADCLKFLGFYIDNLLSFSNHVNQIVSKCSSRIFLLQQLKILGMNSDGLNTFYCSNIRSLLSYAAPALFILLGVIQTLRNEKRYNVVPPVSSCLTMSMMSGSKCFALRVWQNFYTNWARDISVK